MVALNHIAATDHQRFAKNGGPWLDALFDPDRSRGEHTNHFLDATPRPASPHQTNGSTHELSLLMNRQRLIELKSDPAGQPREELRLTRKRVGEIRKLVDAIRDGRHHMLKDKEEPTEWIFITGHINGMDLTEILTLPALEVGGARLGGVPIPNWALTLEYLWKKPKIPTNRHVQNHLVAATEVLALLGSAIESCLNSHQVVRHKEGRWATVREHSIATNPGALAAVCVTDLDLPDHSNRLAATRLHKPKADLISHTSAQVGLSRAKGVANAHHLLKVLEVGADLGLDQAGRSPRPTAGKTASPHPSPSSLATRTWRSTNKSSASRTRASTP
jgi:hypothetical protein